MSNRSRLSDLVSFEWGPANTAVWLAAIVGVGLSLAALVLIAQQLEAHKHLDFNWVARNRARALNHTLNVSANAVATLRDHAIASGELNGESFRMFAMSILDHELGVQALMWAPAIKATARREFERTFSDGGGGFQISERESQGRLAAANDRPEHFPAIHVAAVQENEIPVGFDLGSVPNFARTFARARERGRMAASERIAYPSAGGGFEYGFMVASPIFESDGAMVATSAGGAELAGLVVGFFRLATLTRATISLLEPRGVEILILDSSTPSEERFLHFYPSRLSPKTIGEDDYQEWRKDPAQPRFTLAIEVADRQLLVICGRTALFRSAEAFQEGPWLAMAVGLVFTVVVSFYMARVNEHARQRSAMQQQLVEREELFRQMTETVNDAFWATTPSGRDLLYAGPAYAKILGMADGAERISLLDAAYTDDRPDLSSALQRTGSEGADTEVVHRIRRTDGVLRWVRTRGFAVRNAAGRIYRLVGYMEDITERKLADEALRESEAKLRDLFQQSPDIIMTVDFRGKILLMNRSIPALPADQAVGRSSLALMPTEFRKWYRKALKKVFRKGAIRAFEYSAADGTYWEGRIVPICSADGPVSAAMVIAGDVTEKRRLEAQSMRNARLASIGVLAAGVAHEINNPNNAIQFNASLVSRAWQDIDPILQEYYRENGDFALGGLAFSEAGENFPILLNEISRNSERIGSIVQNLKHMSRQDKGELTETVDLQRVLEATVMVLHNQIQRFTNFSTLEIPEHLPAVRGNSQQLEQVFINVVLNALQALPDRNKGVHICAGVDPSDGLITVTVRDEGRGISRHDLGRLTEPFYTTRTDAGGTGLGLSISRSIVEQHGGNIRFDSALGSGTTVTIRLPANRPA